MGRAKRMKWRFSEKFGETACAATGARLFASGQSCSLADALPAVGTLFVL